jgi:D-serine deaminase-like pyridoxal phosphate-dependent protein
MQVDAGAVGITCQKLGEAEVMADGGLDDILLSFPLLGEAKAERLAALARRIRIAVAGDSPEVARGLSAVLACEGLEVPFLVECDTGFRRTGVQSPSEAAELARLVDPLPGLRFGGLMTYPTVPESGPWLRAAREVIEGEGLRVERVSGGGTPGAFRTHEVGEVTEIRCGTYVYGDRTCIADGSVPLEDCAFAIRAMVVSRPTPDRAILDAGSKTLTSDLSKGVSRCARLPAVGEVVTLVPNHVCPCVNLHDEVVVHRGGEVVGTWKVGARGRIR